MIVWQRYQSATPDVTAAFALSYTVVVSTTCCYCLPALQTRLSGSGHFRNGVKHGYGIYTWSSGDHYEGEYVDDFKHG